MKKERERKIEQWEEEEGEKGEEKALGKGVLSDLAVILLMHYENMI